MQKRMTPPTFFYGFALGFFLCSALVLCTAFYVSQRGLIIKVNTEEIAAMIQEEVEAEARSQIPQMIAEMRKSVPRLVEEDSQSLAGQTASIRISNFTITLPPETVKEFDDRIKGMVKLSLYKALDKVDSEGLIKGISERTYTYVKSTLEEELAGKTFRVEPFPRFIIPVTLRAGVGEDSIVPLPKPEKPASKPEPKPGEREKRKLLIEDEEF